MGSTATIRCWRGRSTSVFSNLPQADSSEAGISPVVGNTESSSPHSSSPSTTSVFSNLPHAESSGAKPDLVVGNPEVSWSPSNSKVIKKRNDLSVFATPLPDLVLERRQRRISKESDGSIGGGRSAGSCDTHTITIFEEGREWYGYRDEGIRQAAEMFGLTGPWVRPGAGVGAGLQDVDGNGSKGVKGELKGGKAFWHGNGRKVKVEERLLHVNGSGRDDEFGIVDEGAEEDRVESEASEDSVDSDDSRQEGDEDGEEKPWWSVRWKNIFMMLGYGVLE
ncbi:hypothetical protein BKA58DRAFT_444051 [Alternaria rosae]|uniref:uncharacterized protein n=1 Tax=Alternaria rosae TaxID=1187941 RepID=UPI001E8E46A6|nr:uncharacterized protein BKA58DRAFT_444051 [Alternaria rosae]KAH6858865.1 hypothetical protein BKA58DRAFT_444051 [Alternaria rosae]